MRRFNVVCGKYETCVKLDEQSLDSYEDICIEAATLAMESFFNSPLFDSVREKSLGIYTVVREIRPDSTKASRFIALTYLVLRNASMPQLAKSFENATNKHQENL